MALQESQESGSSQTKVAATSSPRIETWNENRTVGCPRHNAENALPDPDGPVLKGNEKKTNGATSLEVPGRLICGHEARWRPLANQADGFVLSWLGVSAAHRSSSVAWPSAQLRSQPPELFYIGLGDGTAVMRLLLVTTTKCEDGRGNQERELIFISPQFKRADLKAAVHLSPLPFFPSAPGSGERTRPSVPTHDPKISNPHRQTDPVEGP
jgi:hypothetical protein